MKLKVQTWLTKQNSQVNTKAFLSLRCSEKFQMEGVTTDKEQQEIKELLAGLYNFSAEVLPASSKLEISIVKLKVKSRRNFFI